MKKNKNSDFTREQYGMVQSECALLKADKDQLFYFVRQVIRKMQKRPS